MMTTGHHDHGGFGESLDSVLDDIAGFMGAGGNQETVILRFSHIKPKHAPNVVTAVKAKLAANLYCWPGLPDSQLLSRLPLARVRNKVIAIFDGAFAAEIDPAGGIHNFIKHGTDAAEGMVICGKYSNKFNFQEMQAKQIERRDEHTAHQASRDHLGMIYWTLTGGDIEGNSANALGVIQMRPRIIVVSRICLNKNLRSRSRAVTAGPTLAVSHYATR